MLTIVGVRFKKAGKIYYFQPEQLELSVGDGVIVETARGVEYGTVVIGPKEVFEDSVVAPVKPVIRQATSKDLKQIEKNKEREEKAFEICLEKIEKRKLPMKLINVEYTFDMNKIYSSLLQMAVLTSVSSLKIWQLYLERASSYAKWVSVMRLKY